jgi:hypothetical protein
MNTGILIYRKEGRIIDMDQEVLMFCKKTETQDVQAGKLTILESIEETHKNHMKKQQCLRSLFERIIINGIDTINEHEDKKW